MTQADALSAAGGPAVHQRGPVRWAFSDRHGGSSAAPYRSLNLGGHVGDRPEMVDRNRSLLAAQLGLPPHAVRYMAQVHGDQVGLVGPDAPGGPERVDALVTATPEMAVAVLVADCVPVLLADPVAGVVAAAHAGRAGVRSHIAVRALEAMQELGAEPARTTAWLGPAVCPRCYEVPDEMRRDVSAHAPAAYATSAHGTPALDLRAGVAADLTQRGVSVEVVGPCTAESEDYFSYRREGRTGRFAGVIWIQR